MRESYDIFIKEFLQHPAWSEVIEKLEALAQQYKEELYLGTVEEHNLRKGRIEGVYTTLSMIRGLIQKAKG
jgi:hypothetical protein